MSQYLTPIRPVPTFPEESLYYSTKEMTSIVKQDQKKPPKLSLKQKIRPSLFSPARNKAVSLNDTNLSKYYDESQTQTYFEQCFENICKLGQGSFGEVYKVRFKDDEKLYAVKKTDRSRIQELKGFQLIPNHRHCVQLYQAWEERDTLYMQMELCEKSLEDYSLKNHNIPEPRVWDIFLDLLLALKHLHGNNLLHLDIKPANILLCKNNLCKLADFGLVYDLKNGNIKNAIEGDCKYMAPELMSGEFSKAADIYSLGLTILELSCDLDLPQQGLLWHKLRDGYLPINVDVPDQHVSQELIHIMACMISKHPKDRPSVDHLLQHPKFVLLQKKRNNIFNLMHLVKISMSNWFVKQLKSIKNFMVVSVKKYCNVSWRKKSVIKMTAKRDNNIENKLIHKTINSPIKNRKNIARRNINLISASRPIIVVDSPITLTPKIHNSNCGESFKIFRDNDDNLNLSTNLLLQDSEDSDSYGTPLRGNSALNVTPISFCGAKRLFNDEDMDDDSDG